MASVVLSAVAGCAIVFAVPFEGRNVFTDTRDKVRAAVHRILTTPKPIVDREERSRGS